MRKLLITASFITISSTGAFAGMDVMHATLVNTAKERSFVAGNVVWHCDGTNCVTASVLENGPKTVCHDLVRKSGPVASFEGLDADQLDKCNGTKK